MIPKEKANNLMTKFNNYHDIEKKEYIIYQSLEETKRCALIAVDEILEALPEDYQNDIWSYWKEVKQEIENL